MSIIFAGGNSGTSVDVHTPHELRSGSGLHPAEVSELVSQGRVKLTVDGRLSASLFFPAGYNKLIIGEEGISANGSTLRAARAMRVGSQYEFDYYSVDMPNEETERILESSEPGYYNSVAEKYKDLIFTASYLSDLSLIIGRSGIVQMPPVEMFELLAVRAEYNREHYTVLPESLPQRVYDLAHEITEGEYTQYGKAKAIEEFLRSFTYTLRPGATPEGEDFVDYFLFEQKRGYCTHFASAFTVLCRAVGVPVRYCEGFVLPSYAPDKTVYFVTNAQAHAWPEAYFEGVGWVRFEPTVTNNNRASNTESGSSGGLMPFEEEEIWEGDFEGQERPRLENGYGDEEQADYSAVKEEPIGAGMLVLLAALAVVFLAAGIFISKYLLLRFWTQGILNSDNKTAATRYFKLIMYIAGLLCRERRLNETLNSYSVNYSIIDNSKMGVSEFRNAADILSKTLYSPHIPTDKELVVVKESFEMMKDKLRFIYGRTKCCYLLYIKLNVLKL